MNGINYREILFYRTDQLPSKETPLLESVNALTINNTGLYNAMIHPFTKMVIKGAIWYQGRSS
jgi:hypothetical protein